MIARRVALLVCSTVLGVVLLQAYALDRKIVRLTEDDYVAAAYDLRVDNRERIGYAYDYHGTVLVRTTTAGPLGPRTPDGEENAHITAFMSGEFRWLPWKAAAEGIWYVILTVTLVLTLLRSSRSTVSKAALRGGLVVSVIWWLLLGPLWIGYGPPLYTNWVGPGAASWSGPYFESAWVPGLTVSYRPIIEALALWPARFGEGFVALTFGGDMPWPVFLGIVGTLPAILIGGFAAGSISLFRHRPRVIETAAEQAAG